MRSGERLDLPFDKAGILTAGSFENVPLAKHEAKLRVNLLGKINICHCAFR